MIKELNRRYEPNWDEEIKISLSLRDLQLIYDCVGAVPFKYINYRHETTKFRRNYDARCFTTLYDELEDILTFHNGVIDSDVSLNCDVELKMTGEENE